MKPAGQAEDRPTLSICIPTYNRADLLEKLLEDLAFTRSLDFTTEIVISDNASTDRTPDVIAAAMERLPQIRSIRQQRNNGAQHNTLTALQAARGTYTTYLADDDFLHPENLATIIAHLEANPSTVICHTPWMLEYEQTGENRPFYHIDGVQTFDRAGSVDCFNYIVRNHVFPEHAIYRTDVMHRMMYYPSRVYVGFVWVFKALRHGEVCFHPDSFYRSPVRIDGGVSDGDRGQLGHEQAIEFQDQYRGSLEMGLLVALEQAAPLPLPDDLRAEALSMINNFLLARLEVAARLSRARKDFIGAHEFQSRVILWANKVRATDVERWEAQNLLMASVQAIVALFTHNTNMETLVLCGFDDAKGLRSGLELLDPDLPFDERTVDEVLAAPDRDRLLVVILYDEDRGRLLEGGVLPGHVVWIDDVIRDFRITPRTFIYN